MIEKHKNVGGGGVDGQLSNEEVLSPSYQTHI